MRKFVSIVCSTILFSTTLTANASTVIRLGHDSQETSPVHQSMVYFEQELERRSNGEIEVEIYPARQLGDVRETTEMVQQGNLQMTFGASILLAPFVPEFNVLDVFYLFRDADHAHKALDSDEIGGQLLGAMESKGFHGLGFMEVGFRSITNSRKPIETVDDLKGLKIRAASNPTQISAWRSIGTAPTPLSWGEIFTSLQQGLINAQESGLYSIYAERFYEAQSYLSLTNHMYTNYVLFMNKPFWESLSADQQSLINEVTVEAIAKQRKLAAELNSNVITQLEEKGMAVNEVPQAVRDQMKTQMNAAIYDSLRERTGEQLFDQVISAVEAL
ncbi:C4-dicarboxylate ABC transporter substrate-binding protein [Photobacterium rosenbergii]|uniref:C4-dicarboxylate ABC transporter substrate-binding protein n=1 Tax=Photobacterium rosenbergii TaxID=294936 RepID=A0A2T3MX12_9GAMM|nr:TRAP transporter substrate-binding protein [Photobacterium rosenbergii]PSW04511.1 C4-dicarboxylate ABC transporter substrate-binding protein [Photobacterium rosenbergii]